MRKVVWALGGVAAAAGLVHWGAVVLANQIKSNPDPYPYSVLSKEPQGEELILTRADGTRIRAISAGEGGRTVVLVHGYGVTLQEWNLIWQTLIGLGYRVIAFDLRGHGRSSIGSEGVGSLSMAGDIKLVLDYYDVREGILVGHSMGGFLAQVFLLTYPETAAARLAGVVLAATFAGNVLAGAPQNQIQISLIKAGIMDVLARTEPYSWLLGASLSGERPSPAMTRAFLETFREQPHQRLLPVLQALGDEDYYGRLHEIKLPCVVVCGEKDKTTPPWHAREMGRLIPQARNVWVPRKGHFLNWEAPEVIVEAVRSLST